MHCFQRLCSSLVSFSEGENKAKWLRNIKCINRKKLKGCTFFVIQTSNATSWVEAHRIYNVLERRLLCSLCSTGNNPEYSFENTHLQVALNYLQRLHIFPQTLQDHEVQLDLERPMENASKISNGWNQKQIIDTKVLPQLLLLFSPPLTIFSTIRSASGRNMVWESFSSCAEMAWNTYCIADVDYFVLHGFISDWRLY